MTLFDPVMKTGFNRLRVVDLETTGGDHTSEIIEIGIVDVVREGEGWRTLPPVSKLFRPRREISFHAMAVHHLTPEHFCDDDPHCDEYRLREMFAPKPGEEPADVMVAHSARFERSFIADTATGGLPWICTVRASKQAWPQAPGHSNQVLRYWRGFRLDPTMADPAHRAGPDAWVTAHILIDLLKEHPVERLLEWTNAPRDLALVPFGKHRRKPWSEVPEDYLQWMSQQADMDIDAVTAARAELDRRKVG